MSRLGSLKRRVQSVFVPRFMAYDGSRLLTAIRRLGVEEGDALMVHASWLPHNGFRGRPADVVRVLKEAVTSRGLLAMPSHTYRDSSKAFLGREQPMDARRSASQMGLLSEVFRRGEGVRRSLSPTHPVVAWGERAERFVADHERCRAPFGPGSPFAKLLDLGGKVLCIDASFETVTFTHFLEDRIRHSLSFPLYDAEPMIGTVIDRDGRRREVPTVVISDAARALRREERLVAACRRAGILRRTRVGNTALLVAECAAMTDCVDRMVGRGESFFDGPRGADGSPATARAADR